MSAYPMPPAEVDVSLDVVRRLIADQMPDLADRRLRMLAHGWDNVIVELGGDLLARLPGADPPISTGRSWTSAGVPWRTTVGEQASVARRRQHQRA
jgi:hypothetical protein